MERHEKTPVVEALLFASDEPLGIPALKKLLDNMPAADLKEILSALKEEYDAEGRGITLMEVAGGYVFVSRETTAPWVEKMLKGKRRVRLSRAALETVAVIAYKQPIGRMEIERIRGVDVGGVLSTLLERDLILVKGRDQGPGKPLLYGTTQEFLNYFGLNKLTELPRLEELSVLGAEHPDWSEAEVARFEKAGVEPIELQGDEPENLALGEGGHETAGSEGEVDDGSEVSDGAARDSEDDDSESFDETARDSDEDDPEVSDETAEKSSLIPE